MKKVVSCLLVIAILASISCPVYAEEVTVLGSQDSLTTNGSVEARADVIEVKYRVYNGVPQYRRWNATQGYWVDPEWIDM